MTETCMDWVNTHHRGWGGKFYIARLHCTDGVADSSSVCLQVFDVIGIELDVTLAWACWRGFLGHGYRGDSGAGVSGGRGLACLDGLVGHGCHVGYGAVRCAVLAYLVFLYHLKVGVLVSHSRRFLLQQWVRLAALLQPERVLALMGQVARSQLSLKLIQVLAQLCVLQGEGRKKSRWGEDKQRNQTVHWHGLLLLYSRTTSPGINCCYAFKMSKIYPKETLAC